MRKVYRRRRQHEYRPIHGRPRRGAVSQFHGWLKWLGQLWTLDDRTADGCCMGDVPASATGDLITLTIGGNDLLAEQDTYLREGLGAFAAEHLGLLTKLRSASPDVLLIVGNIYAPQTPLPDHLLRRSTRPMRSLPRTWRRSLAD